MDQELFARFQKCAVEVLAVDRGPGRARGQVRRRPRRRQPRPGRAGDGARGGVRHRRSPRRSSRASRPSARPTTWSPASSDGALMEPRAAGSPSPASASSPRAASARTRSGRACSGPGITGGTVDRDRRLGSGAVVRQARRRPGGPTASSSSPSAAAAEALEQAGGRARRRPGPVRHDLRHRRRRPAHARGADRGPPREGRAAGVAVPRPDDDGQRGRRRDLDALRAAGPERDDRAPPAPPAPTPSATPPG